MPGTVSQLTTATERESGAYQMTEGINGSIVSLLRRWASRGSIHDPATGSGPQRSTHGLSFFSASRALLRRETSSALP